MYICIWSNMKFFKKKISVKITIKLQHNYKKLLTKSSKIIVVVNHFNLLR